MAQKLLLFWRKPARRCWWEGVDLRDVDGVEGELKVWVRRVWTLEMVGSPTHCRAVAPLANDLLERYWIAMTVLPWVEKMGGSERLSLIHISEPTRPY